MALTIDRNNAAALIRNSGGRIFSVTFRKRTGGRELRKMLARVGARNKVNGAGARYSFRRKNLIPVYTMHNDASPNAWRCISIEGIETLCIDGATFQVVDSVGDQWRKTGTDDC